MTDLQQAWIGEEVRALRPDYAALIITAHGAVGGPSDEASDAALRAAEDFARGLLADTEPAAIPRVALWREAFSAFGVRPRSAVSSLESLLRRAADGLPRIDRLTDHYNAISVRHLLPLGGEDLQAYAGPPRLVVADGTEIFDAVEAGVVVAANPKAGEVVWRDDIGVTCRRWNWRQGARTRISPATRDALFIIDGLGPSAAGAVSAAGEDLATVLRRHAPACETASRLLGPDRIEAAAPASAD